MVDRTAVRHGMHPNAQMTVVGYLLGVLLLPVVLPLLPLLLVSVVADWLAEEAGADADAPYRDA